MVPLCLAAMASRSWLGIPIFFISLFKFGFPEVTSFLQAVFVRYDGRTFRDRLGMTVDGIGYNCQGGL